MRLAGLVRGGIVAAGLAAGLALPPPALAHGGTVQAMSAAGPYEVTVFTTPRLLPFGAIDVSAAIIDEARAKPAGGIKVTMRARQIGGSESLLVPAVERRFGADDDYTATLRLPLTGIWRITVLVSGREGPSQTSFTFDALRSGLATTLGNWLLWSAPALFALKLAYDRGRRKLTLLA